MNRQVNTISGRLSLRPPQRDSLEILDRITEILPSLKDIDPSDALALIQKEYPRVADFERDFPSLCFALATGVGKTRLMGAFISYLHLAHAIDNFFVLAPNLTIYNKLITDFTPNTPKYVFKGIAEFATNPPLLVTGDNYNQPSAAGDLFGGVRVNIFNISKINSEVRGGKSPRIKRLSEFLGESYFDYLANLPELVLLMDESHRYRASAGVRAINELKPILGLELTATPYVESGKSSTPFQNVIYSYPLGRAIEDGFVKEPAVVTRKGFSTDGMAPQEIERIKLEDGIRLHESVKVELETYARESGNPVVKPFILIIARDTTHAAQLVDLIQSDSFFNGRYQEKVIQVDSSRSGKAEEEMVERLLKVEQRDEPTEIVVHVNMLKEGWDVTNLYTIVPLRAANARVLIEQSIGRGLRLPYGKRTGVEAVDRLNIVAHDRFQEIVEEARNPESIIQIKEVYLDDDTLDQKKTVVSRPILSNTLVLTDPGNGYGTEDATAIPPTFTGVTEQRVARIAYDTIQQLSRQPDRVPASSFLKQPAIRDHIVAAVRREAQPAQLQITGLEEEIDVASIVDTVTETVVKMTIDIPRIIVVPKGEISSGFHSFALDVSTLNYQPPEESLWIQQLRNGAYTILETNSAAYNEERLEDYIVSGLIDYDDISYDDTADLLYNLATQTVAHFTTYLSEEDTKRVLVHYQKVIARFIHTQMAVHYYEEATEYEARVSSGFTELKEAAFTASATESPLDYRVSPADKSNMTKYLFTGFSRCLYPEQKFHSDAERRLAVILERDALKWFRPVKGQFQIYYKWEGHHKEYQPDFVAETDDAIYMLEPKQNTQLEDPQVLAKKEAAETWCTHASAHAVKHDGKPWSYKLIPHDRIKENMTLDHL